MKVNGISYTLYSLIAVGLTDEVPEAVARSAVALVVLSANAADATVRIAYRLTAIVGKLVTLAAATDLWLGAVVARVVVAVAAADGPTEASRLVQRVADIALATAVEEAASVLAAQRAGEHTVPIVVLHESLVAVALAGHTAAAIGTAANGSADSDALQPRCTVARATDLNGGQFISHVRLYEIGVRVFGQHFRSTEQAREQRSGKEREAIGMTTYGTQMRHLCSSRLAMLS